MSADPLDHDIPREGRNAPLSRPRPGHADLTGMRKYGFDDARPVLERSSARETASRVALGEVAKQFLEQTLGIRTVSHVLSIGGAGITDPAGMRCCRSLRTSKHWTLRRCAHWIRRPNSR